MGVVARLSCHSVESSVYQRTAKLQPVVAGDDEHDEEIKRFFAATPAGNVTISVAAGEELPVEPGDQAYFHLEQAAEGADDVVVKMVILNGWATMVKLAPATTSRTPPYEPVTAEFSIRNETAAEWFQPGALFSVRLVKIDV